jgi:LPS export ABC transporter protein LptC
MVKPRYVVIGVAVLAIVALIVFHHKEETPGIALEVDPETTPTMLTRQAVSMVSDSGYIRYGIQAPLWAVYDQAKEPNWKFPKGLYLEQYDDTMGIVATFECDSAVNKTSQKLWEFIGNVRINNILGDKFMSQQLYWDQAQHKLYSDSFIHIEKSQRVIEGYGFESNELITTYTVNRPTMILPITDLTRSRVEGQGGGAAKGVSDSLLSPSGRRQMPPRRLQPSVDEPATTTTTTTTTTRPAAGTMPHQTQPERMLNNTPKRGPSMPLPVKQMQNGKPGAITAPNRPSLRK